MTTVRCQSDACTAVLEFEAPKAPSSEQAVLATVDYLAQQGWEVVDQHIACPSCARRARVLGITWDGGARTLAGMAAR